LINELIITSNGNKVEYIREYDQLLNFLADLGMPKQAREWKDYEGYDFNEASHLTSYDCSAKNITFTYPTHWTQAGGNL